VRAPPGLTNNTAICPQSVIMSYDFQTNFYFPSQHFRHCLCNGKALLSMV